MNDRTILAIAGGAAAAFGAFGLIIRRVYPSPPFILHDEDRRAYEAGRSVSVINSDSQTYRAKFLHHQLVALSRFSPEDREMLLDYMDATRSRSPQQTAHRDILNAWDDIDEGTFKSGYQGPIDEAVVQSWVGAYRVLIDSMKRARGLEPSSVGADYVP